MKEPTSLSIIEALHAKTAEESSAKIRAYIDRSALHIVVGGFENDDDVIEGKNS